MVQAGFFFLWVKSQDGIVFRRSSFKFEPTDYKSLLCICYSVLFVRMFQIIEFSKMGFLGGHLS